MVKKILLFVMIILFLPFLIHSKPVQADSFRELFIDSPPENSGKLIASKGGWKLIEFWHYSGGYWKATTDTGDELKELVIYDNEAKEGAWDDVDFLAKKIYD